MKLKILIFLSLFTLTLPVYAQTALRYPWLLFTGKTVSEVAGKEMVLYRLDVENKEDYPAELFAAAPDLPPCRKNKNASRTWVDIYAQGGRYLYGFCGLQSPQELSRLAFYYPKEQALDYIYIVIRDRRSNREARSQLVSTTNP